MSHKNDVATAEETAAPDRLRAAIEQAIDAYMSESKSQDILGIEMFPIDRAEAA